MEQPDNASSESTLAAIVFTDVESFTPKMAADEKHTLGLLDRDFRMMRRSCQHHEGKTIKSLGDGLLMYFNRAEQAVTCATEIQTAIAKTAADLPERDILVHRIGIHLGDIYLVDDGRDVMGNGVNIAARLQSLAPPGGVCLSATVYEVVKNSLTPKPTYIGLRKLKGISEPVPLYHIASSLTRDRSRKRVFISYSAKDPDTSLAQKFFEALSEAGQAAFMAGASLKLGEDWPYRIETELQQCDYLLLLLSERSATSEMVTEEVRQVKKLQEKRDGKPIILPIRVQFPLTSPLNYNLRGYLDRIHQREWNSDADTPKLIGEVINLIQTGKVPEASNISQPKAWGDRTSRPQPAAVPELPEGQMDVASIFYVERPPAESRCYETILQSGALIRIKAPRQMGKTSLMARVLHHAQKKHGYCSVPLSFQLADGKIFADLDKFLRWFCASVGRRLRLPNQLNDYWDEIFGSKDNSTVYFEEYLLENIDSPLVLGLDEVDRVFEHPEIAGDFLGLLRAWHEQAKNNDIWKKLRLVVVHSTEVYVPMDINQSPFNVGLPIELSELTTEQVQELVELHGLKFTADELESLMQIVGGHPYLIRVALYYISRQDTTISEFLKTAPTEAGYYGDHLRGHLWKLQQYPELAAAMEQVVNSDEPVRLESIVAFKLHSLGLVTLCGNDAGVRSDLYRLYFRDRL
ncbi:AAA-like domain-containing protein [Lyngbya sp. CCY1209]|uniref:AAA-like domain-containing protein n=1 Tax=Lyngbya sp. CCY1209 TaxID=2886103 RepID=UPI002D20A973|nr:AAA-like domain-containing protein [Lyngbya sp. CCY1209]MEB3886846.1 AAA-like domain-containing protein [Lyngbya sp. CCY1209]